MFSTLLDAECVPTTLRAACARSTRRAPGSTTLALLGAAAALLPGLTATPVRAQSATEANVVVTGTRAPTRIDQALAETTVIDRAQIEQASGRTLPELLAQQPGVQFWSTGGAGKTSSVSLRGLESRHTLLLVDGVRYGSATTGTPSWETIPLESIERIEIVRGPLSGLYGSDAVGGVIQVFTRNGSPGLRLNALAAAGSQRSGQLGAGLRFGHGAVDGAVQLSRSVTHGFSAANTRALFGTFNADDDGYRQSAATARLGWRITPGWRAEIHALHSDGETQYDDGPGADARAGLRARVLGLRLGGPVSAGWHTVLRASRSSDAYDTRSSASPFSSLGSISTVQRQLAWENSLATPLGTALLLAERLEQAVSRPGQPFEVSSRTINGLALGLGGSATVHSWQANVRHDRNSQFGKQTTGSAAYGLELAPGLRAGASWGQSFVAPSFNLLYFPNFSNPLLLPEEGSHRELSLRWQAGRVTSRLAYFDNRIRGHISSGRQPVNIPSTRIDGISASVDALLGAWALSASIDSLNPVNTTAGSANNGKILPSRVQDSARLALDWSGGALRLGGTLLAHGARYDDAANTRRLGGYTTLDLRADWQLAREWTLGVKLNNVGGKRYETVYGYNQPRREGSLTLRYSGL